MEKPIKSLKFPLNVLDIKIIDDQNYLLLALYDINKPNLKNLSKEEKEKVLEEYEEEKIMKY